MCYFITICASSAASEKLNEAGHRGLLISPVENASIARQLRVEQRLFLATSGMCSCDLYRDPDATSHELASKLENTRRRYRKLGWSEAKIKRALDGVASHAAAAVDFVGLRQDVRETVAATAERIGELTVIAHWYHGDFEKEVVELMPGETISPDQLRHAERALRVDCPLRVKATRAVPSPGEDQNTNRR